jgi:hypothetical protein
MLSKHASASRNTKLLSSGPSPSFAILSSPWLMKKGRASVIAKKHSSHAQSGGCSYVILEAVTDAQDRLRLFAHQPGRLKQDPGVGLFIAEILEGMDPPAGARVYIR